MVSKDKYYERKAAGLCTKCGESREGSPSQARCLSCHNKLKTKQEDKKAEEVAKNPEPEDRVSKKMESLKKNSVLANITYVPKICGLCGESVNSFNLFCPKCIKETVFTKEDSLSRYGAVCDTCNEKNLKLLKITSSDISVAMKHKDKDLYKLICYRRTPPAEYRAQCHTCYWSENNGYVKSLKQIFEQKGIFEEILDDDDVIDVN